MAQLQYSFCKNDEYKTPQYAVTPIIKYLVPNSTIWCPFDKQDSKYVVTFREHGFNVVFGHIETGQDFLKAEVPDCDYIISNPPYSIRTEVFQRLKEIGKPFAMLINFQGIFDNQKRFEIFQSIPVEMMYLSPRVSYIKENSCKTSGVPFQSGYMCSQVLPRQIILEQIKKNQT